MVQINARVSEATKALLEQEVRATGIKRETLVEEALLHHLHALHELPADVIIPPRLVVTQDAAGMILEKMENPKPTQALRDLMRRHGD